MPGVRSAFPGKLYRGKLNLAGIGGVADSGSGYFLVGNDWEQVSVTVTMNSTHTKLRTSIYTATGNRALEIDNFTLVPTLLTNPSFENNSRRGWFESYGGAYGSKVITDWTAAVDGSRYVQVQKTGSAAARLSSDAIREVSAGDSFTVSGWLRSSSADEPYATQIRLIARSAASDYDAATLPIVVGAEWTYFETTVTATKDRSLLRTEIMLSDAIFPLEIDKIVLN
jgi:hypothetical protein